MADRPIHLSDFTITHKAPMTEPSVIVPVWITQSTLDGMLELLKFLEGLTTGGSIGVVPGAFDVTMFYRTLRHSITTAEREAKGEIPVEGCRFGGGPACMKNGGPYACSFCLLEWREENPEVAERLAKTTKRQTKPPPPPAGPLTFKVRKGG